MTRAAESSERPESPSGFEAFVAAHEGRAWAAARALVWPSTDEALVRRLVDAAFADVWARTKWWRRPTGRHVRRALVREAKRQGWDAIEPREPERVLAWRQRARGAQASPNTLPRRGLVAGTVGAVGLVGGGAAALAWSQRPRTDEPRLLTNGDTLNLKVVMADDGAGRVARVFGTPGEALADEAPLLGTLQTRQRGSEVAQLFVPLGDSPLSTTHLVVAQHDDLVWADVFTSTPQPMVTLPDVGVAALVASPEWGQLSLQVVWGDRHGAVHGFTRAWGPFPGDASRVVYATGGSIDVRSIEPGARLDDPSSIWHWATPVSGQGDSIMVGHVKLRDGSALFAVTMSYPGGGVEWPLPGAKLSLAQEGLAVFLHVASVPDPLPDLRITFTDRVVEYTVRREP